MLCERVTQEHLEAVVELVASVQNRSDQLKCVPKKWLLAPQTRASTEEFGRSHEQAGGLAAISGPLITTGEDVREAVTHIHSQHHFGVERTLELVQSKFGQLDS